MKPTTKLILVAVAGLVVGTAFGSSIPVIGSIAAKLKTTTAKATA